VRGGPVDSYQIDSLLTEEEKNSRSRGSKFVDKECLPVIADHFDRGTFPMHLIPRMAEMGLFGLHVEGFGCQKASHTVYGLVSRELGRGDSGFLGPSHSELPNHANPHPPKNGPPMARVGPLLRVSKDLGPRAG